MEALQIKVALNTGTITTNSDELKEQLSVMMSEYETQVFTEETKQAAKAELANLRKLREAVEKRRKEIKTQCMAPYNAFEKEVKELVAIIDKPIGLIDHQLKEMEEVRKAKRREEIQELFEEMLPEECRGYLTLEKIYDRKWENAGTSMKKIREDLQWIIDNTMMELETLHNSMSDVKQDALDLYKRTNDLKAALALINTYEANKRRAFEMEEERRRQEEERRHREEIERVRAEERRRIEEEERIRREEREKLAKEKTPAEPEPVEKVPVTDDLPNWDICTAVYKITGTMDELEEVDRILGRMGISFERRNDG